MATIGQRKRISAVFTASETPTDPTTVAVRIESPSGDVATPTPEHDGDGLYHYDLSLTESGPWSVRFEGTGVVPTAGETTISVDRSPFFVS